jgi:hypothetical protein
VFSQVVATIHKSEFQLPARVAAKRLVPLVQSIWGSDKTEQVEAFSSWAIFGPLMRGQLDPKSQRVMALLFGFGRRTRCSALEVAEITAITPAEVARIFSKAKAKLRRRANVEQACHGLSIRIKGIEALGLCAHTVHTLHHIGIKLVSDLEDYSFQQLVDKTNCAWPCILEVQKALHEVRLGLHGDS